ncbi:MAG TPA: glycosyltransferase family 2 protein [Anaerolineae bacterium]|nr:glycosyltransferase family 2 protein [Anaerolineae bacterium]
MSREPSVMVIVLTYNRWEDTCQCLASIYRRVLDGLQVVVVDNGSTDETTTALRAEFPQVHLIVNSTNLGYADGNNVGLHYALEQNAEFALVLNNDAIVAPDCIEILVDAARANDHAALFGPLVLHADEPNVIQSAGGMLPEDWHAYHRASNQSDKGQFQTPEPVAWLTGCAILTRVPALREIGLLDASFYMYGEDVDWCVRAHRARHQVLFVPRARVWHKGVTRNYAPTPYITYYSARNELQLIRKHHAGNSALLRAWTRHLRTLASWSLLPRWQAQRAHRNALARALRDFARGATGPVQLA